VLPDLATCTPAARQRYLGLDITPYISHSYGKGSDMVEILESDREKFVRLATSRVNKAIDAIRIIGNLSNRSNYSYTEADVEKIFRALQSEMKACRQRFSAEASGERSSFRLD
jgi:hypothetical protein